MRTSFPKDREELALLLDLYLLDKAVYELGYELNNRPSWVRIPLDGISQLLQSMSSVGVLISNWHPDRESDPRADDLGVEGPVVTRLGHEQSCQACGHSSRRPALRLSQTPSGSAYSVRRP